MMKLKFRCVSFITICWPLLFISSLDAQEKSGAGPVGIFASQAEYDQFMGAVKRSAYGPNGSSELQAMVPLLNDIALNRPFGATASQYNTADRSTLDFLADPKVRADLDMVDSQYDEMKAMNSQIQRRLAQQIRGLDFTDSAGLVERIRTMKSDAQRDLDALLLPHQVQRLRQIAMQSLLRQRKLVDVITSEPMKSELEITESQSAELKRAETEIEQELARKISKLREEARDKLLSRLKPAQAQAVKERIGDAFDFPVAGKNENGAKKKQARQGK